MLLWTEPVEISKHVYFHRIIKSPELEGGTKASSRPTWGQVTSVKCCAEGRSWCLSLWWGSVQHNLCFTPAQLMWTLGSWLSTWVHVFNEDSYKQEIGLISVSREVLLHKLKFVNRREGSVCSLPVSCFICSCGSLLIFQFSRPVWIMGNLLGYARIVRKGKEAPSQHPAGWLPSQQEQLLGRGRGTNLGIFKLKKRSEEEYLHRAEDGFQQRRTYS